MGILKGPQPKHESVEHSGRRTMKGSKKGETTHREHVYVLVSTGALFAGGRDEAILEASGKNSWTRSGWGERTDSIRNIVAPPA